MVGKRLFEKLLVIAEVGMTHDGSFGLACQLLRAAAAAGADVVKFQLHISEYETTRDAPNPPYFGGESRYDYFNRTRLSDDSLSKICSLSRELGVIPCISVFSEESALLAAKCGFAIIKIPSGEVSNIPLLRVINRLNLPVIISSGMSSWSELDQAIAELRAVPDLCVLQCTSLYPTPSDRVGLNVLQELRERYNLPVGLSDHTLSSATSVAAVVLGARVVEKHFTLSKLMFGPDAKFSLEPSEFEKLVGDCKFVADSMESPVDKDDLAPLETMKQVFQKSVVAKKVVRKGELFTNENLTVKKPGTGIPAREYFNIIGKKALRDLAVDDLLETTDISDFG